MEQLVKPIIRPETNVADGYRYLSNNLKGHQISSVLLQIQESIQQAYQQGNYILPKTIDELQEAFRENRMISILGRDENQQIRFLSSCTYTELGKNENGQMVCELGTVITNPNITVNTTNKSSKKPLVFPINSYLTKAYSSFASQAISALVQQIINKDPNSIIIATTRSLKSQLALLNSGFGRQDWTGQYRALSCDERCLGRKDHRNCHLADLNLNNIREESGCHLMVYSK